MSEPWLNPAWRPPADRLSTIVFVHGAIVNGREMFLLRRRLAQVGYRTRLFQYRSITRGIEENVRLLVEFLRATEGDELHVVGHSMGGVLTRQVFEENPDPRPGRQVAIGSPLLDCWLGHRVSGLHGRGYCLLGRTVHDHILRQNSPLWQGQRDFGVIAGTYPFGIGRIFGDLPVPSDGVVLWEETRLEGLRDHVTLNLNHFGLLLSRRCATWIARFLATGSFLGAGPGKIDGASSVVPIEARLRD